MEERRRAVDGEELGRMRRGRERTTHYEREKGKNGDEGKEKEGERGREKGEEGGRAGKGLGKEGGRM